MSTIYGEGFVADMNNSQAASISTPVKDEASGKSGGASRASEDASGGSEAERAAWLADKIVALGDYAKEAAAMLRRWPTDTAETQEAGTYGVRGLSAASGDGQRKE